jgi:hypothetical protein
MRRIQKSTDVPGEKIKLGNECIYNWNFLGLPNSVILRSTRRQGHSL